MTRRIGEWIRGYEPHLADTPDNRLIRLLARIRHRQLMLALGGRISESARFAERARRVREIVVEGPSGLALH